MEIASEEVQSNTSRKPHAEQWRRLLFSCLALFILVMVYRLIGVGVGAPPDRPTVKAAGRPVKDALKYLRLSARNASLNRRAPSSPTALEMRVREVLQRRWPHTAGAAATTAANARPLRVRVATVANRVDFTVCAEQASAFASGVKVSVVGFGRPYSHVTRLQTYLEFAEKEGLADDDVVMLVDSDTLWTGFGLEDAVAKFVALPPPSQASLWPAAVRAWEDYGEHTGERFLRELVRNTSHDVPTALVQLPPVLFSAERYCNWMQKLAQMPMCPLSFALVDYITDLARNGYSGVTPERMTRYLGIPPDDTHDALEGVRRFLASRGTRKRGKSSAHRDKADPHYYTSNALCEHNVVRYLNAGGVLMRVWALRLYTVVFRDFLQTQNPSPMVDKSNRGWYCDQSVHGALYVRVRMFEAAQGLLDATPGTEMADGPYRLPPRMTGLDRRSAFFLTAAGVLWRRHRIYVGTEYHQRYVGHLVFRLLWYLRRLRTWWIPGRSVSAIRRIPAASASGCALTPLLLRRPPCREDVVRGYHALRDDDADVAVPPVVHIPGDDKDEKYAEILR
ncbi:putative expression-site associated protein [Leptomonas pyrrhocoris]|uniref:Putative expression-site associated protein n=1 Tax=Leptomonas pyrrhocoris TaxID=157538 RepID=A0A0M9FVM8_LEPPY|nr:putative expression-site associated protein [Leptomonas pyrrhocoris]KPA76806.1 putative expression-site associated protein [Leptomonas pyrrhocoris]|eukprot:XP_015655245.1 putative expression-site associated protein [Leptomonas pyrrhocoris]